MTSRAPRRTRLVTPRAVAAAALLAVLGAATVAGCSSGSSGDDSGGSADAGSVPAAAPKRAANRSAAELSADTDSIAEQAVAPGDAPVREPEDPSLIKRGTISLESDDVEAARLAARKVVDIHNGSIDEEETATDDDGDVSTVRMVLRVPAADFDQVVEDLKGVATLTDASTSSTDVRDRVIRTNVQIGVQRDAIDRIRLLLDRATSISDIIRIEGELTDRIARLETLRRTAAYLADQTSMSTINLYIEKTTEKAAPKPEEKKRTGFIGGLDRGWGAFTDTVVWIAGAVGTVLPFAVTLLVLGVPLAWLLRRRLRTLRPAGRPPVTPAAG
jgi:hypothetical protein